MGEGARCQAESYPQPVQETGYTPTGTPEHNPLLADGELWSYAGPFQTSVLTLVKFQAGKHTVKIPLVKITEVSFSGLGGQIESGITIIGDEK